MNLGVRRNLAPRQIERTVIELDHVALADQPVQVGSEREFSLLRVFVCKIDNQLFSKFLPIDARRGAQCFENGADR